MASPPAPITLPTDTLLNIPPLLMLMQSDYWHIIRIKAASVCIPPRPPPLPCLMYTYMHHGSYSSIHHHHYIYHHQSTAYPACIHRRHPSVPPISSSIPPARLLISCWLRYCYCLACPRAAPLLPASGSPGSPPPPSGGSQPSGACESPVQAAGEPGERKTLRHWGFPGDSSAQY